MADQRVIDYIKTNLSNGFPLEQIKQALIDVGWKQEEINSAIDSVNQGPKDVGLINRDDKKNISGNKGKKIILISIAIVIIFCVILGFLLYPGEISFGNLQMKSMSLSLGTEPKIDGRYINLVSIGENDEITIEVDGVPETIEHSSKKVVNGVEIKNVEIEDNNTAKIKIKVIEPKEENKEQDNQDDEKISSGDNNIIDCGQSADLSTFPDMEIKTQGGGKIETNDFESDSALVCFGNNLFKCNKAKVILNDDENGMRKLEIKGKEGSDCLILQEFGNINSSPFEYLSHGKLECPIPIEDIPTIYFLMGEPEDENMIGLPAQSAVGVSIAMMFGHMFDTEGICNFESANEDDLDDDSILDCKNDMSCFHENLGQCKPVKYNVAFIQYTIKGWEGDKCKIHGLVNANIIGEEYKTAGTYYECLIPKEFLNEEYSEWLTEQWNSKTDACKGTFIDALNQQIIDKTIMFVYMGKTIKLLEIGSDQKVTVEVDGVSDVVGLAEEKVINGLRVKNLEILDSGNAVRLQFGLN